MLNSLLREEISQEDQPNPEITSPDIKTEELKAIFRLWRDDAGNSFIDLKNENVIAFIKKLDNQETKKIDKINYLKYINNEIGKELRKFGPEATLSNPEKEYREALQIFNMVLDEKDLISPKLDKTYNTATTIKNVFAKAKDIVSSATGTATTIKDVAPTIKDSGLKIGRNML